MLTDKECQKLWDIIKDIKVGMLTSVDDKLLRARPMHNVQDEFKGKLWYFTDSNAHKVAEIQDEQDVCISYADPKSQNYVSLSGKATLTRDEGLINRFWNPFTAAWFNKGKDDDSVALLEITVQQAEYWDAQSDGVMSIFEIVKANLTDKKPDLGHNHKYG